MSMIRLKSLRNALAIILFICFQFSVRNVSRPTGLGNRESLSFVSGIREFAPAFGKRDLPEWSQIQTTSASFHMFLKGREHFRLLQSLASYLSGKYETKAKSSLIGCFRASIVTR